MLEIHLNLQKLAAIALLASKDDIRQYLNGVYVEATASETRLAATNGHYAGMLRRANDLPNVCEYETVILPPDMVERLKPKAKSSVVQMATILIIPRNPDVPDARNSYSARLWDGTLIPFEPIDGKFPDIRRVMRAGPSSGVATGVDVLYLAQFMKVNKALGCGKTEQGRTKEGYLELGWNGDASSITVKLANPDFVGICMSCRGFETTFAIETWPDQGPDAAATASDEEEREFINALQPDAREHA